MGTQTISLADGAYERLKAEKREGESFIEVVGRLTNSITLGDCFGKLGPETADELEAIVSERREQRTADCVKYPAHGGEGRPCLLWHC
jgi:predicted CopG family antitoxin